MYLSQLPPLADKLLEILGAMKDLLEFTSCEGVTLGALLQVSIDLEHFV